MEVEDIIRRTKEDLEMEKCPIHGGTTQVTIKDGGGFQFEYCCDVFRDRLFELAQERMARYAGQSVMDDFRNIIGGG